MWKTLLFLLKHVEKSSNLYKKYNFAVEKCHNSQKSVNSFKKQLKSKIYCGKSIIAGDLDMIETKKYKLLIIFSTILLIIIGFTSAQAASNPFTVEKIEQLNQNENDIVEIQSDKIKNTATFHNINDTVTYQLTIKNNENKDFIIKEVKDNNTNKYISYSYNDITNQIIPKESEKDLIITATYEKG